MGQVTLRIEFDRLREPLPGFLLALLLELDESQAFVGQGLVRILLERLLEQFSGARVTLVMR